MAATSPLPQSEEGEEGIESYGEDPLVDNTEKGESVAEELGEEEEDSDPPTTPDASIQKEPRIRTDALNEVPELE
ncbi:hypothetical protein HAX54_035602 [Datura stramonium]|uniref:Uncharacterized protein n=1 Tax=Datura stramonium TaxID=4076 RepID=A0ABS8SFJ6_DATST|nr:hypothetical protein [Datura stramonium]